MKFNILTVLALLALASPALEAEPVALSPTAAVEAAPVAAASPSPNPRLSFGVGYPDLRVRGAVWGDLDAELKVAFDDKAQAYSGRLYYSCWRWDDLDLSAGAEAGYISFAGLEDLTGNGSFYEAFVGARYALAKRIGITAEAGPALINLSAEGQSVNDMSWIITTAIYFNLF